MPKLARQINASVIDTDGSRVARRPTTCKYEAVDEVRFRVALTEAAASESDRPMYRGYGDAVHALEHLAEQLPAIIAAARDPLAAGAAAKLVRINDVFRPFNDGCAGAALSVLWDGARSLLAEHKRHGRKED